MTSIGQLLSLKENVVDSMTSKLMKYILIPKSSSVLVIKYSLPGIVCLSTVVFDKSSHVDSITKMFYLIAT